MQPLGKWFAPAARPANGHMILDEKRPLQRQFPPSFLNPVDANKFRPWCHFSPGSSEAIRVLHLLRDSYQRGEDWCFFLQCPKVTRTSLPMELEISDASGPNPAFSPAGPNYEQTLLSQEKRTVPGHPPGNGYPVCGGALSGRGFCPVYCSVAPQR